jgi:IS5 family transposase
MTDSEGCVTNAGASLRCCTKDGSRPPGVGLQEKTSNRQVLLRSNGVVVNDLGKGICKGVR